MVHPVILLGDPRPRGNVLLHDSERFCVRYREVVSTDPTQLSEITVAETGDLIERGGFLLDVREDDEWEAGHAPAAVHIPMGLIAQRISDIPVDRSIVCICRSGGRSGAVATALAEAGLTVHNLTGGMTAWEIAGLPIVTDAGGVGQVI
jgi:rhodanese-related sulfurtransferase